MTDQNLAVDVESITPDCRPSRDEHVLAMAEYMREGTQRALELGNRGPIRLNDAGTLHQDILDAYWQCGFYVFEGVVGHEELADLEADIESVLERAPFEKGADVDSKGRPALGVEYANRTFLFAKSGFSIRTSASRAVLAT